MNKEIERNSAGVRVVEGTMENVWTGKRYISALFRHNGPDVHEMYKRYDPDTHIYLDFAGECLHQGLELNEIDVNVHSVAYRGEDGKWRRDLPIWKNDVDHVDIEIKKPCRVTNALLATQENIEAFAVSDAQLIRSGNHFAIVAGGKIYTDHWYEMYHAYKALSENIKIEHVMNALTNKSNFPNNEGPVSVGELASKAMRENKRVCASPDIENIQQRIGGQWVHIAPEDVMPGMDIRTPATSEPLMGVLAVEYRDGQLTIVTPDTIFCSNSDLLTSFDDLKGNIAMVTKMWEPNDEWREVIDAHGSRMSYLSATYDCQKSMGKEDFTPADLQRNEEYFSYDHER